MVSLTTPRRKSATTALSVFELLVGARSEAQRARIDDLLAAVKRGLLITRFHYINGLLDTRKALFTGMTRDGTFLIENGKITKAVKNLRFNDSMLRAYSNVEAVTKKRGVAGRNWGGIGSITAPSVLIRDFKFTGTTEF